MRFQRLFTPLAGVLFTFSSRYWFTIGHQVVFSLGKWSSQLPTGLHVSRCTQLPSTVPLVFVYGPITLLGRPSQAARLTAWCPSLPLPRQPDGPTTQYVQRLQAFIHTVWAFSRS